jgi:thioredoxin-like negative regulator of GroEL
MKSFLDVIVANEFEEKVLKNELPVILFFYTTGQETSEKMLPAVENTMHDYADRLNIFGIEANKCEELCFTYGVKMIPMFIIFFQGIALGECAGGDHSLFKMFMKGVRRQVGQ